MRSCNSAPCKSFFFKILLPLAFCLAAANDGLVGANNGLVGANDSLAAANNKLLRRKASVCAFSPKETGAKAGENAAKARKKQKPAPRFQPTRATEKRQNRPRVGAKQKSGGARRFFTHLFAPFSFPKSFLFAIFATTICDLAAERLASII